jgi:6,7-dimethyl-8-ribityllumazine synthase
MALSSDSSALLDYSNVSDLKDARVAIVSTEWNDAIIKELKLGAYRIANEAGIGISHDLIVPGCFEITFACNALMQAVRNTSDAPEAIIAFGTVIRGGTPHFDYVCKSVTEGITQLNLQKEIPVIFGVLTLDNEAQAWERLGGIHGHKGEEAMIAALKMIKIKRDLLN